MEPFAIILGESSRLLHVLDILHQLEVPVYGYILISQPTQVETQPFDIPLLGTLKDKKIATFLKKERFSYFILEEDPKKKRELYQKLKQLTGREPGNIIHPNASLSSYLEMGRGNFIGPYASIRGDTVINGLCWIGEGTLIETEVEIGNYVTIEMGAKVGKKVSIENDAYIGHGAILYPGIRVGEGAKIGPGSVVLESVPAKAVFLSS
jgi:acetyltransferase-like isoleucine patch superfamily enzyme